MTAETGVRWLLRFISIATLPLLLQPVMPRWLVVLTWIEPGSRQGRHLCAHADGCVRTLGCNVYWSTDVRRYRPLILTLCVCVVIAVPVALAALVITVPQAEHSRAFWIIFVDLAEGLAHTALLAILVRHVPRDRVT
jgi:hypothetical protein